MKSKIILLLVLLLLSTWYFINNREPKRENVFEEYRTFEYVEEMLVFEPKKSKEIPFEVTDEFASIQLTYLIDGDFFQEASFHYQNSNTNQKFKLIVTYNSQIELPEGEKIKITNLLNGILKEESSIQSIWWIEEGLVYRLVYYINEEQEKLTKEELITLVKSME